MADEEFFLIVRPTAGGTDPMLSDTRAAEQHTVAAQVVDVLHAEELREGASGPSPAGALGILTECGRRLGRYGRPPASRCRA
ncbi:hypothetical protein [Streptomyces sp. NPDC059533]|uniref:hypothetical protein n=1 Tax=unclassified Streptomyces TaxID=2593676 RepID=UPI0036C9349C